MNAKYPGALYPISPHPGRSRSTASGTTALIRRRAPSTSLRRAGSIPASSSSIVAGLHVIRRHDISQTPLHSRGTAVRPAALAAISAERALPTAPLAASPPAGNGRRVSPDLTVLALHVKSRSRAPMQPVATLAGLAGHGLAGDASAHPASPRHVLLVAEPDLAAFAVTASDLRANLTVRGDLAALTSGTVVTFGSLALRITIPCEPCARLDQIRPRLARALHRRRGVLARVVTTGTAALGDRGRVLPHRLPALADDWRARVAALVLAIPTRHVITYAALTRAAGAHAAHCRALPTILRTLGPHAPIHRVIPADPTRLSPVAAHALAREGLDPTTFAVHTWDPATFYAAQEAALSELPALHSA